MGPNMSAANPLLTDDEWLSDQSHEHAARLLQLKGSTPSRIVDKSFLEVFPIGMPRLSSRVHGFIVTSATKPSRLSLDKLKPIAISDLKVETRHTGTVLFARVVTDGTSYIYDSTGIEDDQGKCCLLNFITSIPGVTAADRLPEGMVIAIKEPYLTLHQMKDHPTIQIHHLSDVVSLPAEHPRMPPPFAASLPFQDESAASLREMGNKACKMESYSEACRYYTAAMQKLSNDDLLLRAALLGNRSLVKLKLDQCEGAKEDAQAALQLLSSIQGDAGTINYRMSKAHYHSGKASYALQEFSDAAIEFELALALRPGDAFIEQEKARTTLRQREALDGDYDFSRINLLIEQGTFHLDVASFFRKVTIRRRPGNGRGVFATRDIKAGEIVMCEKAIAAVPELPNHELITQFSMEEHSYLYPDSVIKLWWSLLDRLHNNPDHTAAILELYAAQFTPVTEIKKIDGMPKINAFHLLQVVNHNNRCWVEWTHVPRPGAEKAVGGTYRSWLWTMASSIKHSCNGNATPAIKGDLLIIRALRDIAKDDEICMPFYTGTNGAEETITHLADKYNMKCDCLTCESNRKTSPALLKKRAAAQDTLYGLAPSVQMGIGMRREALVPKLITLRLDILSTYAPESSNKAPKPALAYVDNDLSRQYLASQDWTQAIRYGHESLKHFGWNIDITQPDKLVVDRKHAMLRMHTITVMVYLNRAYVGIGNTRLAGEFLDLARQCYTMLIGDDYDFDPWSHGLRW